MYLIQNIQVPMQSYYLKLLNMCKFAHDRKTLKRIRVHNHFTKFWEEVERERARERGKRKRRENQDVTPISIKAIIHANN